MSTIQSVSVAKIVKRPLEIHIKGTTHIGKTHVMEIIRQALISHGISHAIESIDHPLKELDMIDTRDPNQINFVNERALITLIDRNERPEQK